MSPNRRSPSRVAEIGRQITADYEGQSTGHPLVLIGVLKGAAIFLSDLARAIRIDNTFDFVAVSSYGRARVSSGAVKLIKDIDNPIEGRHVILVEDILDTGLTLSYLRGLMLQHKPASLKIATCLDKPEPPPGAHRGRLRRLQDPQPVRHRLRDGLLPRCTAMFRTSAFSRTTQATRDRQHSYSHTVEP